MVVLSRVILLMAESSNRPGSDMAHESSGANENKVEYADIMKALSASHLREIGIALKTSRPGWQEAHVQVGYSVGVWFVHVRFLCFFVILHFFLIFANIVLSASFFGGFQFFY